jgi:hypothetical protein
VSGAESNGLVKISLKNQTVGTVARMYFKMSEHNAFAGHVATMVNAI